jgi:hypothetical protein
LFDEEEAGGVIAWVSYPSLFDIGAYGSDGDGRPECSLNADPGLEALCELDGEGTDETKRVPTTCLNVVRDRVLWPGL